MGVPELQQWLLGKRGFRSDMAQLEELTVARQFRKLRRYESIYPYRANWPQLLTSASLLARGDNPAAHEAALRIAQSALEDPECDAAVRDAAGVILDQLANRRAIELATERDLIGDHLEDRLGIASLIDWTRRGIENSVELPSGKSLQASGFQRRFWRTIDTVDWLSASAPTSAGKSFIITQWIVEQLTGGGEKRVVYLAPTRALIQQVERDLREMLLAHRLHDVQTVSIPFNNRAMRQPGSKILVFTQERLHYFLRQFGSRTPIHAVVIDEAHKIGDRHRGVLLQSVVEQVARLNPQAKVIFAAPLVENPATLVADAPADAARDALLSNDVTVNQNLLWLDRLKGRPGTWELSLCLPDRVVELGDLEVDPHARSIPAKMAHLAIACDTGGGTLIYANTADQAEKVAAELAKVLPHGGNHPALDALAELSRSAVHEQYGLPAVLGHGVAFHYGNMPLVLRTEIEALFRSGELRFLVCTSTLVEGVNLPCRTLIVRAPRRGDKPMDAADFWNLAGRAGRWGKEFQGNIICVDARAADVWKDGAPRARKRFVVARSTDRLLTDNAPLLAFLKSGAKTRWGANEHELETMTAYLATTMLRFGSLATAPWAARLPRSSVAPIEEEVGNLLAELGRLRALVGRHPNTSPAALRGLFEAFGTIDQPPESLLPVDPAREDAPHRYSRIFDLIRHHLSANFGFGRSSFALALTTCAWMRGHPIPRIISRRLRWHSDNSTGAKPPVIIRDTLRDIEEVARFQAPQQLACYLDVLAIYLAEIDRNDLAATLPDFTLALEFGVGNPTELALLALGLSRSAALAIAVLLRDDWRSFADDDPDHLDEETVLAWFVRASLRDRGLPSLILREAEELRLALAAANDR